MKIAVWNILDMVEEYGEDAVKEILSVFSCKREKDGEAVSLNPDIEHFIKNNAIQFARQKVSVSYIVGDEDDGTILGYFTIPVYSLQFMIEMAIVIVYNKWAEEV